MTTSPSPLSFSTPSTRSASTQTRKRVADLESQALLVEKLIPKLKDVRNRLFYREVVESYRAVARDILQKAWSDEKGQDIAEYAVMLAVILVLVVGTIRLVGSNANTVFSQAASSIQ